MRAEDRVATTAIVIAAGAVLAIPFAAMRWHVEPEAWPFVAVSSVIELAYFVLLVAAYQRADMSLVYPIARGSAPVFVLLVSVLLLGAPTSGLQIAGVALVALGVLVVRGLRGGGRWSHVALALAVGVSIAAYTVVDKEALRYADPIAYGTLILSIPGVVAVGWVAARPDGAARLRAALTRSAIVGGIFSMGAYALVLIALATEPAASVAAVRESSVVIAAMLGWFVLHERAGPTRLLGAVVVALGVGLVVAA